MSDREQSVDASSSPSTGISPTEPTEVLPIPLSEEPTSVSLGRCYSFRGCAWSRPDLLAALQSALATDKPDPEAWACLLSLAEADYLSEAPAFLAAQICLAFRGDPDTPRPGLRVLAGQIASERLAEPLVRTLAGVNSVLPHELALWTASHLASPLAADTVAALCPLLWRRRAASEAQLAAAAVLFQTVNADAAKSRLLLKALTRRCTKQRSITRLRQLQEIVGPHAHIRKRIKTIENRLYMRCPRCGVERRRPRMVRHLWIRHRLLLDGNRAREPWKLVEAWIDNYVHQADPQLLKRCEGLVQQLDPERGLARLQRLLLVRGPEGQAVHATWRADARIKHGTLCPVCYALAELPREEAAGLFNLAHGRLSRDGYSVEVVERGVTPHLRVETPTGVLYDDSEPDIWFTPLGVWLLFALPTFVLGVTLALVLRFLDTESHTVSRLPVLAVLIVGTAVYLVQRGQRGKQLPALARAVDHAWNMLVPVVLTEGPTRQAAYFFAGLGAVSLRRGHPRRRTSQLDQVIKDVETAVRREPGLLPQLAILRRLETSDRVALGDDPVLVVAKQVGRCFAGELPVPYAQDLLEDWEESWWTSLNLVRLRALLCDLAFECGLEVRDLIQAGHAAPALGQVLSTNDPDSLCALRWLWSQRAQRPWDDWGKTAVTVFEAAESTGNKNSVLARYPDLLLLDEELSPIVICQRGVYFMDILFTEFPRYLEVKTRRHEKQIEYEILIGSTRYAVSTDPTLLIRRLERWIRYRNEAMVPRLQEVFLWPRPAQTKPLLWGETVTCAECREMFLPDIGGMGRRPVDPTIVEELGEEAGD